MSNTIKMKGSSILIKYEGEEAVFSLETLSFVEGEDVVEDIYFGNDDIKIAKKLVWVEDVAYAVDPDEGHFSSVFDDKYKLVLMIYLYCLIPNEDEIEELVELIDDSEIDNPIDLFKECFGVNNYFTMSREDVKLSVDKYISKLRD